MTIPVLEIEGVSKRFGTNLANDDISLTLAKGEIVALLGENGAGKTTLMSILFGHYMPDAGRILIDGAELPQGKPRAAIRAGVGMVHQHFSLAPNLTVLENVMTGTEKLWSWRSGTSFARKKLLAISERFGLKVDPDARLGDLSVGEKQRVEILKALYNDARILILDEPTAVLTNIEAEKLFTTLKEMARQGLSLIFISHKLDEVMAAADRIVVLRSGKMVAERKASETSKAELAELMVGRRVTRPVREPSTPGTVALEAADVTVKIDGVERLKSVSFHLREGEILGIIGVSGNGQAALAHLLSGTISRSSGDLLLFGEPIGNLGVGDVVNAGIGRIPEDRNEEGVIGEMAIWENAVLERVSSPAFSQRGLVNRGAGMAFAKEIIDQFDVRGGSPASRARLLSGGNMQKLILGRNLHRRPRILIAAQPARGLDEGAVAAVHARLLEARRQGTAVLLISEDLDEVIALADRIQAVVGGRLSPPVEAEVADARELGLMMAGEWQQSPEADHAV
ncbi:ABC transporter ATP-binding protein [Rhizobium mongolense]|uniref:Simple sugar transport system ATP-binding protein n=2 Tax=Rhizobium mongolense TaxID=57676 RepID=A0ABR6IFD9_9HYPH|nr:ABC transporter ATP-binding protein [Rhizobium mongolense]MBB4226583.1 simple sugar transport system ATP-binding protein [Rhizobium mongolense]TVZ73839.1 simple sugar transport system ATP-binding protein [Rhizobium mongolense USDA 1844]